MKSVELFFVHLFNDYSGSPRVFRDAIESSSGEENRNLITSPHPGFLDGIDCKRINTFYARSNNKFMVLFYYLISQAILFFLTSFLLLKSRIKGNAPSLVVNTLLPFGALLAGKLFANKVTSYVHETSIQPLLLKQFLRFIVEHSATNVIFVSKYLQSVESFHKPQQNHIYNGLRSDFPAVSMINQEKKFTGKQLLFVGSLKKYKGVNELICLAKKLPDFKVIALLNCSQSEKKSFFYGVVLPANFEIYIRPSNISEFYANSFCVLNLSLPDLWVETFGLSLLEGMAYGSPVVAPPVGGPTEFVNCQNGLLADSREVEFIAKYMVSLSESFENWKSYSDSATQTASGFTTLKFKNNIRVYFSTQSDFYS